MSWAVLSMIILGFALLSFFWRFEKRDVSPKEIALISTMASMAAISRVLFAAIMNVQPTTFVVMITGYVFGPHTGFVVGAIAALVSNFFLGQGPWTPWQMFSWGMCGVSAGLLAGIQKGFKPGRFTVLAGLWGYVFGWIMNIWHWTAFVYPLNWKTFVATYAASFPFDTLHAAGNVVFALIFGQSFYYTLSRFRKKISVKYIDDLS